MSKPGNNDDIVLLMGIMVAGVLCYIGWRYVESDILHFLINLSWQTLNWIDGFAQFEFVKRWKYELYVLNTHVPKLHFTDILGTINKVGYLFITLPVTVTIFMLWRTQRFRYGKTKRRITPDTMKQIMASHADSMIPLLHYDDLLHTDPPEHRSALSLEEWVMHHRLRVNGVLDDNKTASVLEADLGHRLTTLDELQPHEAVLCKVFCLCLFDHNTSHDPDDLLRALNVSCQHGSYQGKPGYPSLDDFSHIFPEYAELPQLQELFAIHPYSKTLLMKLHNLVIARRRLATSSFRWLKGMDRSLWYALNTVGRKTAFIESLAVFVQMRWESFAAEQGFTLPTPCLQDALAAIQHQYHSHP